MFPAPSFENPMPRIFYRRNRMTGRINARDAVLAGERQRPVRAVQLEFAFDPPLRPNQQTRSNT
jgi:hypothetical protein